MRGVFGFFVFLAVATAASGLNADDLVPPGFSLLALGDNAPLPGGGRITVSEFAADQAVTMDTLEKANAILFEPARLGMAPPELHVRLAWLIEGGAE